MLCSATQEIIFKILVCIFLQKYSLFFYIYIVKFPLCWCQFCEFWQTQSRNHHYNQGTEKFHYPNKFPSVAPVNYRSVFCSYDFTFSRMSYKGSYTVWSLQVCLLSLSITYFRFIHFVACIIGLFFLLPSSSPLNGCTWGYLFTTFHLQVEMSLGHLDCFQVWEIMNKVAMNIHIQFSFFLGKYPVERLLGHMVSMHLSL